MIPRSEPAWQARSWQQELSEAFTDPLTLLAYLGIEEHGLDARWRDAASDFRMLVPRSYAARMQRGRPDDPLLRQVLPLADETLRIAGFAHDPVGDLIASPVAGLIHKYHGRALIVATGACAVNCRYCFRRHYPYARSSAHRNRWEPILTYLKEHDDISEVILSGGDPLVMDDARLRELGSYLTAIPHLRRLRIHSRLPVVLPRRVTSELIRWLGGLSLQTVVVIHANHPRELAADVPKALGQLNRAGVTLLNQSVLLRGVNDNVDTLAQLSEVLFENAVHPYYLHLLDRVEGAAHFLVETQRARAIHHELRCRLPGYLVPQLVSDREGAPAKLLQCQADGAGNDGRKPA